MLRSISHGNIEFHRKFPKTESLKDCMSRTIPYFKNVIYPQSIAKGKNVLIASSENAIRGLLMYLCGQLRLFIFLCFIDVLICHRNTS